MNASLSSPSCDVCVLTPFGRAAVATIAVEGQHAMEAVATFFRSASGRPLDAVPLRRIVYGQWITPQSDTQESTAGEGVVACRTAPHRVEIHCHGGKAAVAAIVDSLVARGCREIDGRTWAAVHEPDPIAAEARIALAEARTRRTAAILLDQHRGALRQGIENVVHELESGRRELAKQRLDDLLRYAPLGLHLTRPWRVVLAGRPNVGKSSLINALLGYRRAIVHDTPGVTRDVLTAQTALDGWPVELADTAGVRESEDRLEAAGVASTRRELQTADAVVLVFDASQPWSPADEAMRSAAPTALLVHNKCDLALSSHGRRPPGVSTSAVTGEGLPEFTRLLLARLVPHAPQPGEAVPFTTRQVEALREANAHVEANNLPSAAASLRSLL